jgi:hypothetical protein
MTPPPATASSSKICLQLLKKEKSYGFLQSSDRLWDGVGDESKCDERLFRYDGAAEAGHPE